MSRICELVREARGELGQAAFGAVLGKSQAQISKYEKGTASPPNDVTEKCMAILNRNNFAEADDINAEMLAEQVRKKLNKPQHSHVRKSLSILLDGLK